MAGTINMIVGESRIIDVPEHEETNVDTDNYNIISFISESLTSIEIHATGAGTAKLTVIANDGSRDITTIIVAFDRRTQQVDDERVIIQNQAVFGNNCEVRILSTIFGVSQAPTASGFAIRSSGEFFIIDIASIATYTGDPSQWNEVTYGSYIFRVGKPTLFTQIDCTPGVLLYYADADVRSTLAPAATGSPTVSYVATGQASNLDIGIQKDTSGVIITPMDVGIFDLAITIGGEVFNLPIHVHSLYGEPPVDIAPVQEIPRQPFVPAPQVLAKPYQGEIGAPPRNTQLHFVANDINIRGVELELQLIDRRVRSAVDDTELGEPGTGVLFSFASQFVEDDIQAEWPRKQTSRFETISSEEA